MKILVSYRGIPQSKGWETGSSVVRAFESLGHEVFPYGTYYQSEERIAGLDSRMLLDKEYDLLLFMECGDGDKTYFELNQVRARKTCSWFFDAALYPDKWRYIVNMFKFDCNFIANKNMVSEVLNGEYLPYAADQELHYRNRVPKERDFAIIGSDRPERRSLANKLGIELKTGIFREEYIDYLATTGYIINDTAGGGQGLIPMRPFEVLMAGSKLITPKGDGCKELGLPCIEYESEDSLVNLCEKKCHLAIQDGQEFVLKNHTYINRCQQIIESMSIS